MKAPVEKSVVDTKSDIGRKWRVLGMKVRVGAAVTKRRNINDAETFIVKETEVKILF